MRYGIILKDLTQALETVLDNRLAHLAASTTCVSDRDAFLGLGPYQREREESQTTVRCLVDAVWTVLINHELLGKGKIEEGRMKTVYVAGPFRADSAWGIEENIRWAEQYGLKIAKMGAAPVIPHTMYRFYTGALPDQFWLDATLEVMRHCDAVFMCAGWGQSSGSRGEKAEAERLKMPVFENLEDVRKWLEGSG